MIMNGRASLRLPRAGVLTLAVMAAAALPAWAVSANQQQPPKPSEVQKPKPEPPVPQPKEVSRAPRVDVRTSPQRVVPVEKHPPAVTKELSAQEAQLLRSKGLLGWTAQLTDEGERLVKSFEAEREAIQAEAETKVQARRDALVKELKALQDQYAKAGQLDEAVAIRDYLRAGGPQADSFWWIKR